MKRLLLISNSVSYGKGYLEHVKDAIRKSLSGIDHILFVPYAASDFDTYTKRVTSFFDELNITVEGIHTLDQKKALVKAKAIFVGGGNTFRLLKNVDELGIVEQFQRVVFDGTIYIGSSAGVNLACPTIKTTNDMPIVFPRTFDALKLIDFQINPHYIDKDPHSTHLGETREERISEFHQENDTSVLGLYEGSWLEVEDKKIKLYGEKGAKLFLKQQEPKVLQQGLLEGI